MDVLSLQLDSRKKHERGRVAAVHGLEVARQRVLADEAADADLEVPVRRKVIDVAAGQLADRERVVVARIPGQEQLVLVCALRAREKGVRLRERDARLE